MHEEKNHCHVYVAWPLMIIDCCCYCDDDDLTGNKKTNRNETRRNSQLLLYCCKPYDNKALALDKAREWVERVDASCGFSHPHPHPHPAPFPSPLAIVWKTVGFNLSHAGKTHTGTLSDSTHMDRVDTMRVF